MRTTVTQIPASERYRVPRADVESLYRTALRARRLGFVDAGPTTQRSEQVRELAPTESKPQPRVTIEPAPVYVDFSKERPLEDAAQRAGWSGRGRGAPLAPQALQADAGLMALARGASIEEAGEVAKKDREFARRISKIGERIEEKKEGKKKMAKAKGGAKRAPSPVEQLAALQAQQAQAAPKKKKKKKAKANPEAAAQSALMLRLADSLQKGGDRTAAFKASIGENVSEFGRTKGGQIFAHGGLAVLDRAVVWRPFGLKIMSPSNALAALGILFGFVIPKKYTGEFRPMAQTTVAGYLHYRVGQFLSGWSWNAQGAAVAGVQGVGAANAADTSF